MLNYTLKRKDIVIFLEFNIPITIMEHDFNNRMPNNGHTKVHNRI